MDKQMVNQTKTDENLLDHTDSGKLNDKKINTRNHHCKIPSNKMKGKYSK